MVKPEEAPITEENPLRPLSPYAVSKVGQDFLGYQYFMSYGTRAIRTRGFNHEGPRRGDVFVCSNFAKQLAEILPNGERFTLPGFAAADLWPLLRQALVEPLIPLAACCGIGFLSGALARSGAGALGLSLGAMVSLDLARTVARGEFLELPPELVDEMEDEPAKVDAPKRDKKADKTEANT